LSFRFTYQDFRDCRPNKRALQRVRNRFKILEEILLERLPLQFNDLKKLHYVCRIREQGGKRKLRKTIWLGMANIHLYANARGGIQYQVGINSSELTFNGIWIEGTYNARLARLKAASRLTEKRFQFVKELKRLGADFSLWFSTSEDEGRDIPVREVLESDIDELIDALPRYDTYVHIGKVLRKKDVVDSGNNIVNIILRTAEKLLPTYRLLTEGKARLVKRGSRSIPSTAVIHESSAWGMRIVKAFERSENRKPKDVSTRVEGYDIESTDKRGYKRYIEVKSRRGGFRVSLTENEFNIAKEKGNSYYLYVVRGDDTIRIIKNPAGNCDIRKVNVPEFEVCDWVQKGKVRFFKHR